MKILMNSLLAATMLWGCQHQAQDEPITNAKDYAQFLKLETLNLEQRVASLKQEVIFWQAKIKKQPEGFLYFDKLAGAYNQLFELTGDVSYLSAVDSIYEKSVEITDGKWKSANYIALASNAIKRHDFKKSLKHGHKAMETTDEKFGPLMMQFDASMELGYFESAFTVLKNNYRPDSFDYLVRLSKYQDHVGNLDSAITLMEDAYEMVKYDNSATKLWAQTNLADMYGHAGRLERSYQNYLEVLKQNADYRHALKGIAWLAYSRDGNLIQAKEIIHSLNERTQLPDGYLLLAEIAAQEADLKLKRNYLNQFMQEAARSRYEGMYNKYIITLMAEEYGHYNEAIALAKEEITHRSTPLTHSLLAWCYELKGDHKKALDIIEEHVVDKTFEPEILYHIGVIYLSNDNASKGIEMLKEALDAKFELGPQATQEINKHLYPYT